MVFLPGLGVDDIVEHTKYLQTNEFQGLEVEHEKTMWLYSGSIKWKCRLNKNVFLLNEDDIPVVSINVLNESKSREVQRIEFSLAHHMKATGWSWEGHELAQNRRTVVDLQHKEVPLVVVPGEEKGIQCPLQIVPDEIPKLPPSVNCHSISLEYTLKIFLCVPGATEKAECTLPIRFVAADWNREPKPKEPLLQSSYTKDNNTEKKDEKEGEEEKDGDENSEIIEKNEEKEELESETIEELRKTKEEIIE